MKYQPQERKIKTVTITLTQSCNLKCSYCYENNKSPKIMTFNTAQQIIDKELKNKDKYTGFEIDLFGGEPFLQFELIKQITDYACQKLNDFPHTIFLTTNGTLVHGDVQKWLIDHKDCVICGLSLDGTREMHNTNRSNSFDSIDIDFFAENYPMQDIKMTISRETLPTMAEGVMYAHKRGFEVSCNLAYDIDWSDPDNVAILDRELHSQPCIGIICVFDSDCIAVVVNANQYLSAVCVGERNDFLADIVNILPLVFRVFTFKRHISTSVPMVVWFYYIVNIHFCQVNEVNFVNIQLTSGNVVNNIL